MGLYSLMIDNLFKRLNRKKKLPFSSSSSSKKSRLFWRDTRSPKKEKKDTLEGISISPGKNHEGRYTFQIFFERRISKPRVYRVHSPAALPWNSAPQNSDLSIDIYAVYTHGAYIHIYLLSIASLLLFSFALCATVVIRSMQIPLQNRGKRKRRGITRREKQFAWHADIGALFFPICGIPWRVDVEERSRLKSRGGGLTKEFWREEFWIPWRREGISFLFLLSFYIFDRTKLSRIIIDLETRFFWKRTYSGSEIIECFFFKEKLANNNAGEKYVARIFTPPRPSFLQRHQGYGPPVFPCTGFASLKYCRCFGRRRRKKKKRGKNYRGQLLSALEYKNRDCVKTVRA